MAEAVLVAVILLLGLLAARVWRQANNVHACARSGRLAKLAKLLNWDPTLLEARNRVGETPIHQAAKYGEIDCLRLLVERGGDVNAADDEGATPLHFAAAFGEIESARLLLNAGASPDEEESTGLTPIVVAMSQGHEAIAKMLQAGGAAPYLILPSTAVPDDDPLLLKARARAQETRDVMLGLFPEHTDSTTVKVPFTTDGGQTEHIWCDLLAVDGDTMKTHIRTYPHTQTTKISLDQDFPLSEMEDWQVELRDGTLRGGYSFAVFFRQAREEGGGALPPELEDQHARYLDLQDFDEG